MHGFLNLQRVSHIAGQVDDVFIFIAVVGLFFFVVTQGFLLYFAVKYRRTRVEGEVETPYITGNHILEIIWIVIPSLGVLAIFIYGFLVFQNMRTVPAGSMEINVTAGQWLYRFRYPDGRTVVNEVRVPVGKPVKFIMNSTDVIHGFYLPAFRVKTDILPGRYTYLWVQPEREGRYDIYCTEYCGTGHSIMRAVMVVMGEKEYRQWMEGRRGEKAEPTTAKGEELVEKSGCVACHSLDGTDKIGPTLNGLFGRKISFSDGTVVVADENYIRESLMEPNAKIVKGFPPIMPTFRGVLTDEDVAAIIAYIKTVR